MGAFPATANSTKGPAHYVGKMTKNKDTHFIDISIASMFSLYESSIGSLRGMMLLAPLAERLPKPHRR
jgi:hypothetical protein